MRKPRNRKERIEFLLKKIGIKKTEALIYLTDKQLKQYFELRYKSLMNADDYSSSSEEVTCIRCDCVPQKKYICACGEDMAVFSKEDYLDLLKSSISPDEWSDADETFCKEHDIELFNNHLIELEKWKKRYNR